MSKKMIALMCVLVCVAACGGVVATWLVMRQASPGMYQAGADGNAIRLQGEVSVAKVAQEVSPSVVSIMAEKAQGLVSQQGAGTGIIVSADGYVITNKHVIEGATNAAITRSDGTVHDDVKIIGTDPLNDVAFLKINHAKDLPAATLGESSTLQVGQTVVAIGNTLGEYQNTVTSGIVSGLGRPVAAQSERGGRAESLTDLVQTDAAINPGNSGGPLVNLAGQVVGINTAVVNNAQGIGFAIPINAVKGMLAGVLAHGKVERPYLGVRYVAITPAIAKQKKLPVKKGALVAGAASASGVEKGGPADRAGMQDGDIIVKIGELAVGQHGGVSSLIAAYKPGDTVQVTVLREGKEQVLKVQLVAYTSVDTALQRPQTPLRNDTIEEESLFDSLFGR